MIPLLLGVLVIAWVWLSHGSWRSIGYVAPKSWVATIAVGILFGILLKLALKSLVMPALGAPPINAAYQFLQGNPGALPGIIFIVVAGAGFGEETFYRGFLFHVLERFLGSTPWARVAIVAISTALFALAHLHDQGRYGMIQAAITGGIMGSIFAVTGEIFFLMIAHAAFDLTAVALIYWGWETPLARLVFK